jgi:quercetin dioxygenase-like cupin family protein
MALTPTRFRFADLPADRPMDLLERRRVIGEKIMISEVRLTRGCRVPSHAHENEQICVVLDGRLRFGLGNEGTPEHRFVEVAAGELLTLPSNVPHSAEALADTRVLDLFSPPSETTGIDAKSPQRR